MIKYFLGVLFPFFFFFSLQAQIDTSFWFVGPQVPAAIGVNSVGLQFGAYSQSVTILIRQPANPFGVNMTVTLAANSSTVVDLTPFQALITSTLANASDNKGLYISASRIVSANYIISSNNGQESLSLKGSNGVGDDFYTPFPGTLKALSTGSIVNAGFDIMATESGTTTLLITPAADLVGPRTRNITFVTTLTQGQTFSCQERVRVKNPTSIVTKDFNNDLVPDVAFVDQSNSMLFIFINNGAGVFTELVSYTLGILPTRLIAADLNGDNNQDLMIANTGGNNVFVFLGNGNGTFQAPSVFSTASRPVSLACADMNGDTFKDLAVVCSQSNSVTLLAGNGSGGFAPVTSFSVAAQPADVVIADFNNDAVSDLVIACSLSNSVTVLLGSGPFTFSSSINYAVGTFPVALATGDFNADTRLDIAVANRNSNNVSILKGAASPGTFSPVVNYATAASPVSIVSTTINVGTDLDLAVACAGSSSVSVLIGSPSGTFAAAVNNAVGAAPNSIHFADVNGDNLQDLVTANFNSADFSRLLGNTTATLASLVNTGYGATLPTNLSGSIVSADKKITVTMSGAPLTSSLCPSFYADQITNTGTLGKDFVIHSSNTATDVAYILATVNSTSLTITSSTVTNWLINTGETFAVKTTTAPLTYIKTDKPVYIFHMAGNSCKLGGAQIAPAYCAGSYTTGFARMSVDSLFLQIYTRNGYQATFTLEVNGVAQSVPAVNFTVVPGTSNNLVGARIYYNAVAIPVNAYCVLKNSADIFGLSVQNGSSANGNQFSQVSNFQVNTFVSANPVTTATICSNTQFTLNGVVGGGPITGIWSTNGFGTLSGGPGQLANNVYIPNPVDTNISPIRLVLTSTGICPNKTDTLKLTVKQGPIVSAGSGSVICSNNPTVQLTGDVYGATNQGVWSVVAPGNGTFTPSTTTLTPFYLLSNSDTAQVLLKFVLTSTNNAGCNAEQDTVRITVNKAPVVKASATNPVLRCANNATVFLNGTVSGTTTSTGKWESSGSGVFVPNNLSLICNYIPSPADLVAGSLYLILESTNNQFCREVRDSVLVIFTQPASPNAGIDLNSCKNNPRAVLNGVITGTATSTGVWLGGAGIFVPSNTALTNTYYATPAEVANGFVTLTFSTTNNGFCAGSTDRLKITFQDKPTANFTVNTVCMNQVTLFTDKSLNTSGLGALTGWDWDLGDGTITGTVDPVHTYPSAGTYTAQLVVKNTFDCYDTVRRPVVVYSIPTASLAVSRSCNGSAQLIRFEDRSSISPPYSIPNTGYYWDFGGEGFSNARDTAIIFPSEGIYSVTHIVTSNTNCKSVITQSVNITPKPRARFKIVNNSSLSLGATIAFLDSSNIVPSSWSWSLGNGDSSHVKDPTTTYTANGTYTIALTIADQFGCTDTFTSTITIKTIASELTQLIPNMITPNGDGKNDIWRLDFLDVFFPGSEIEIYSRWGERIFRSIGYSNAWDGSYKGDPLPVGAYFYVIKLNNKENQIFKGTITLMK